jgi:poly(A) polymerase
LCFAALLHQLAKKVVLEICHRFRLSNEERDRIVWLTSHHQQLQSPDTLKRSQLFPILVHPGIGELLALHSALALAIGQPDGHVGYCLDILRNIPFATLNPEPLITGETLKDRGLEPGPRFKTILDNVRNAQLDQEITSPAEALALVDQIVNRTE